MYNLPDGCTPEMVDASTAYYDFRPPAMCLYHPDRPATYEDSCDECNYEVSVNQLYECLTEGGSPAAIDEAYAEFVKWTRIMKEKACAD